MRVSLTIPAGGIEEDGYLTRADFVYASSLGGVGSEADGPFGHDSGGGRLKSWAVRFRECGWRLGDDNDAVGIMEMPDQNAAAALSMAIMAGGACQKVKITPLMSMAEGVEAIRSRYPAGVPCAGR